MSQLSAFFLLSLAMDRGGGGKLLQSRIQVSIFQLRCLNKATAIHIHVITCSINCSPCSVFVPICLLSPLYSRCLRSVWCTIDNVRAASRAPKPPLCVPSSFFPAHRSSSSLHSSHHDSPQWIVVHLAWSVSSSASQSSFPIPLLSALLPRRHQCLPQKLSPPTSATSSRSPSRPTS